MSILTPKMVTSRIAADPGSAAVFFPFNEGSGTSFSDVIAGVSFSEAGAAHATAHGATMSTGASAISTDAGTVPPIPAGKSAIFIACNIINTSSLFNGIGLGNTDTGGKGFICTNSFGVNNVSGTAVVANFSATESTGQSRLRAGTWNGVTGEIRAYSGVNGGAVAFDNTNDASSKLGEIALDNKVVMGNNTSFDITINGVVMCIVDSLPSDADLLSYLDVTYANFVNGRKIIDPRLLALE